MGLAWEKQTSIPACLKGKLEFYLFSVPGIPDACKGNINAFLLTTAFYNISI